MTEATPWYATWTQAVTDFRSEEAEGGFGNVTVRMTAPASLSGSRVRVELSNRFGDEPVRIGRGAIGIGDRFSEVAFDGLSSTEIPPGASRWTDPIDLAVRHSDELVVDLYLPEPTPYATAAGFSFSRSSLGDFVGACSFPLEGTAPHTVDQSREYPAANTGAESEPEGTGWSLPPGGPFLRAIEVAGVEARAVIVALGASSTAMGWPQYTAALLPADAKIAVANRGIAGNRIRLDAPQSTPSWGRSGLSRFDEDVLGTAGATHLVIAYNSNDWGLPGRVTPMTEMPSVDQLIEGYQELIDRARAAGLEVILATVMPLAPELLAEPKREDMRQALNAWIRRSGHIVVDFDAAVRCKSNPSRLTAKYAAPDDTHPSVNGSKRLAQAMVEVLQRLKLWPVEDV
ncbi:GDSL-type esterase/lipase family protein [Acetobacteraceae bacterium KSS8]|uniref:GDSL-type esterase/lipase family protein n=1 Tax=Endosaccharibacter trunci TaxID=2812733 RepID=A0ABT1W482_9PROT|nr:GDSL-type esterase/lipase family protein [Acetobacteraceae bacterium KSS8]